LDKEGKGLDTKRKLDAYFCGTDEAKFAHRRDLKPKPYLVNITCKIDTYQIEAHWKPTGALIILKLGKEQVGKLYLANPKQDEFQRELERLKNIIKGVDNGK